MRRTVQATAGLRRAKPATRSSSSPTSRWKRVRIGKRRASSSAPEGRAPTPRRRRSPPTRGRRAARRSPSALQAVSSCSVPITLRSCSALDGRPASGNCRTSLWTTTSAPRRRARGRRGRGRAGRPRSGRCARRARPRAAAVSTPMTRSTLGSRASRAASAAPSGPATPVMRTRRPATRPRTCWGPWSRRAWRPAGASPAPCAWPERSGRCPRAWRCAPRARATRSRSGRTSSPVGGRSSSSVLAEAPGGLGELVGELAARARA